MRRSAGSLPAAILVVAFAALAGCSSAAQPSAGSTTATSPADPPDGVVVTDTVTTSGYPQHHYACAPARKPINLAVPYGQSQHDGTRFWLTQTPVYTELHVEHGRTPSVTAIVHLVDFDEASSFATREGRGNILWSITGKYGEHLPARAVTVCY